MPELQWSPRVPLPNRDLAWASSWTLHTPLPTPGGEGLQKALGAEDIVVLYRACASNTCSGFWSWSLVLKGSFQIACHVELVGYLWYVGGLSTHVNADEWMRMDE